MRSYDDYLKKIGAFGKYQKIACFLMFLSTIPNGYLAMSSVFTQTVPEHYCNVPEIEEWRILMNYSINDEEYRQKLRAYIPNKIDSSGKLNFENCLRYENANVNGSTVTCDKGWIYNVEPGLLTIVNEWDIVCDNAWQRPMSLSLYAAGILVGSFVSGILSDKYGRRPVFLVGTLGMYIFILLLGISVNIYMYMAMYFMSGFFALVNYVTAFVFTTEITGTHQRAKVGSIESLGSAVGYLILPACAYFIHDWRWLLKALSISCVIYIPYYWWVPESPRWLLTSGRTKEAIKIVEKMSKVNGKHLTEDDLTLESPIFDMDKEEKNEIKISKSAKTKKPKYSYFDLFFHKALRQRAFVIFFLWFSITTLYYTLSLNTSNLGGDKYINCFIAAALEAPAYWFSYLCIEKFGRRITISYCFFGGGLFCGIAPFFASVSTGLVITSTMIAKFLITASFNLIYIYTAELFPTMLRNTSIGAASMVARIGGIIAPYLIFAGLEVSIYIPFLVNGFIGILAGLSVLILPETLRIPLPETVEEAKQMEKYKLNAVRKCRYLNDNYKEKFDQFISSSTSEV